MTGNLVAAASSGTAGTMVIVSLVYVLVGVAVYCWYAAALGAVFAKMGVPRWKAWVPVVSQMAVLERAGRPAWHVVIVLLVPVYGLWVWAMALHRINQSFGRGGGYTVLALLLSPVWASLLGWGPDQPDFEPRRMYQTMAPSMGRGPLAMPESVPTWAGAPMAATASLAPGQPWAPEGGPATAGDQGGFGQPAAAPGGLPPVLQAPVPGQMPEPVGQPGMFSQAALPEQPVVPGPAAFGQPVSGEPAAFGQPALPEQPVFHGEPAVFGQPGEPAVFGQPVSGEPAAFGQPGGPAAFGQPGAPDQPAAFGQPWPHEQAPWPQPPGPSTHGGQLSAPASGLEPPYAPQPVDLASFGQVDAAPSDPAPTVHPDPVASAQPFVAAPAPVVPAPDPARGFPVPDPRFAAPAAVPVSSMPSPTPVPDASVGATPQSLPSPEAGLIAPPPGAVLPAVSSVAPLSAQPMTPPVAASAPGAALAPSPAPEPVASLPATSLPAVSATPAPPPLTLVGSSSDAQQTVVIPLSDDDIDGTVVVRRPTFQPWVLSLDDGRTFVIRSRSVVLGRRPESVDLGVQVLTITDDGRTISKTHARLDLVDDVWRVVDMGSTNGVVATDANGEEVDVEPGKATPVYGRLVLGAVGMRLTPGGAS